jgi:hypothetical protein
MPLYATCNSPAEIAGRLPEQQLIKTSIITFVSSSLTVTVLSPPPHMCDPDHDEVASSGGSNIMMQVSRCPSAYGPRLDNNPDTAAYDHESTTSCRHSPAGYHTDTADARS